MFPLPALPLSRGVSAAEYTISSCFNSKQSWSPVGMERLAETDRRDSRAMKFPLVNCCCRFILPCFASAEVATNWNWTKVVVQTSDTTEPRLWIIYVYGKLSTTDAEK